jgi:uncharacterized membrane protein
LKPDERRVLDSALSGTTIARDVGASFAAQSSLGGRLADGIARVGGSWGFILCFLGFLVTWVVVNTLLMPTSAFDPYPFIFLNLVLSMIAAIQAPIIMMSQNRAADRDRLDASHDYEINLKAEIEILALHDKLDEMRRDDAQRVEETLVVIAQRLAAIEARLPLKPVAEND